VLGKMVDNGTRCCKRASRMGIKYAMEFLEKRMDIKLKTNRAIKCGYTARNKECIKEACAYY